jgi:hypothetical protein
LLFTNLKVDGADPEIINHLKQEDWSKSTTELKARTMEIKQLIVKI